MDTQRLYEGFLKALDVEATPCQDALFRDIAKFLCTDEGDIFVINGYAGTGKTTALGAVINVLRRVGIKSVLLAPTGRAAKVLSAMSGRPASTVHKHIYRQKSVDSNGYGQFSLSPNKAKHTLFVVDEASLIGVDLQAQNDSLFGSGDLLSDLVSFVRSGEDCRLILLGDAAQLPPVGLEASPALTPDYMDGFGGVSYATLTSVVRQASDSGILDNATRLRRRIENSSGEEAFEFLDLRACIA